MLLAVGSGSRTSAVGLARRDSSKLPNIFHSLVSGLVVLVTRVRVHPWRGFVDCGWVRDILRALAGPGSGE